MGITSDLKANFDCEIVDEFLDHYSLMVESMKIIILDLAKADMYERSINELLRVFHNIKSAANYLQIHSIFKLATFVANMLESLRTKEGPANEETGSWLRDISDMFATWNSELRTDQQLSKVKIYLLATPDI